MHWVTQPVSASAAFPFWSLFSGGSTACPANRPNGSSAPRERSVQRPAQGRSQTALPWTPWSRETAPIGSTGQRIARSPSFSVCSVGVRTHGSVRRAEKLERAWFGQVCLFVDAVVIARPIRGTLAPAKVVDLGAGPHSCVLIWQIKKRARGPHRQRLIAVQRVKPHAGAPLLKVDIGAHV